MFTVLAIWMLTALIMIYALIDGEVNPVTSRLTIDNISPVIMNNSTSWYRVVGTFEKYRDCEIDSISWFYGDRDDSTRVAEIPVPTLAGIDVDLGSIPTRLDVGEQTSAFLRVRLDPMLIESNSYAYVYHRCYSPWLWKTRTLFYDSALAEEDRQDTDS